MKKIENLDFYDLLNLDVTASRAEVEAAYLLAVATYHQEGLASYGALSPEERQLILEKIEEAFLTLSDREKRSAYNSQISGSRPELQHRAHFRKGTERLMIEDAPEEMGVWERIRLALNLKKHRKDPGNHRDKEAGGVWLSSLPERFYYGEYLKKVREKRGISLEEMAQAAELIPAVLKDLEEENAAVVHRGEDFDALLKRYARALGLDSENGRE